MLQPVVLCGGSGTRLWPVSRKAFPKQFAELVGGRSLLALTLERVAPLAGPGDLVCVGAAEHHFLLGDAVARADCRATLILEPCARSTAAAMVLAALNANDPDQLQLFCPADHHIPDAEAFRAMVAEGTAAANAGAIVVFGVAPTFASTAYGYIEHGAPHALGGHQVLRFVEKPSALRAQQLLRGGRVDWNAGIFLCRASVLLEAVELLAPDILACCRDAMRDAQRTGNFVRPGAAALQACRSESIDVAVMQRHGGLVVFPFQGAWSDVGSWDAVAGIRPHDEHGNSIEGHGVAAGGAQGTYIHAPHRRVVALGTNDLLIVDTPDAVLVANRSAAEDVKDLVHELERRGDAQAVEHRKVLRPWGYYDSMERGPGYQVKRLYVNPLGLLSLQLHHHRSEHWVVVRGMAEATIGTRTRVLRENDSVAIPVGTLHRLYNPGPAPLEVIEVQTGDYLGEDDIVRFDDAYGRPLSGIPMRDTAPVVRTSTASPVPNGELHVHALDALPTEPE